jgi:hypothetical protein
MTSSAFHGKQGKSNNQSQHTQTTKEDRQVEHLIRTIRRNAKIQNGKENHKATHSSRYQKTETPPLPAKPPKTNKGADYISRKQINIKRIGMRSIYFQNNSQIVSQQSG